MSQVSIYGVTLHAWSSLGCKRFASNAHITEPTHADAICDLLMHNAHRGTVPPQPRGDQLDHWSTDHHHSPHDLPALLPSRWAAQPAAAAATVAQG